MDFCFLLKTCAKILVKNKNKNLSYKYSQKLLDHAKKSATDAARNMSKKVFRKTSKATGDLISNKFANNITKVSRSLPQYNSETITNKHDKELSKERYISSEENRKLLMI